MAKQILIEPLSQEKSKNLDQLCKRIWSNLIKYCRTLTRDAAAAEDLAQDTVIRIVNSGRDLTMINEYYFYRTAKNIYLNWQRDSRLEAVGLIKPSADEEDRAIDPITVASFKKYQEERADERARENALSLVQMLEHICSKHLTEEEVELVTLRFIDKLDFKIIAERVGKPRGQVQYETYLAWKKFKHQVLNKMRK